MAERAGRMTPAATLALAVLAVALPDDAATTIAFQYVLPILAAYACGASTPLRAGLPAVVVLLAGLQIRTGFADAPNLEVALQTLAPWWIGRQVRRRAAVVAQLAARTRELEAEEEAFVRLSVRRERARIARDLHDIVSHHLAVMVVQAGAGRLTERWEPTVAADRFAAIRDAGEQALAEADRLVTLLAPTGPPAPRLADLLDRARATGAVVELRPPAPALAPAVEAIAHRVLQEALTNALKHAPGAPPRIRLVLDDGALELRVHNAAAAHASPLADTGSGLGLAGMRERLLAVGGTLEAGPDGAGGFLLRATVPVSAPTPSARG